MPTVLLVVNADDLGHSPWRDAGILAMFRAGVCTSASLLVTGGSSVREAVAQAEVARLPLGLHFNITEGRPCTAVNLVPTLVDSHGCFWGKMGLRRAAIDPRHVEIELKAQLAEFSRLVNRPPTHVDGHQHCHVIPGVAQVFARTLAQAGVLTTRLPLEPRVADWVEPPERRLFYDQVLQEALAARSAFDSHHLVYAPCFAGLSLMGNDCSAERVVSTVLLAPVSLTSPTAVELMVHPGLQATSKDVGANDDAFHSSPERVHEVSVLSDARLRAELETIGAELSGFSKVSSSRLLPAGIRGCIAVVSPARLGTGNMVTASRLRSILLRRGFAVVLVDVTTLDKKNPVRELIRIFDHYSVQACFGLHAVHSGSLVVHTGRPYVIILGGTDVNVGSGNVDPRILNGAQAVVAFNDSLAKKIKTTSRVLVVPQAIELPKATVSCTYAWPSNRPFFLLPIGIRPVKDPLFLLHAMHQLVSRADLIISGPILDDVLGAELLTRCGANVKYAGVLARSDVVHGMRRAKAVLNSSLSEGMSNSVLEAMAVGTPVLARHNPGNAALVEHGVSGLLFSTTEEFARWANALLDKPELGSALARKALDQIKARHDIDRETMAYGDLADAMVGSPMSSVL